MRTFRNGMLVLLVCASLPLAASTASPSGTKDEVRSLASSEAVGFQPEVSESPRLELAQRLDTEIERHHQEVQAYLATVKAEQERQAQAQRRAEQEAAERAQQAKAVTSTSSPPPASSPTARGSCGGWEDLISSYFGSETGTACRVMMCESHGNPTAYNPSSASGLFQFLRSTWQNMLGMSGEARDHPPEVQIAAAKRLRDMAGWSQWSCA